MPHAAIRLRRQPLRVASLIVAAALSLAAATINDAARFHLTASIDANWRGAYDILVRPQGQRLDLEKTLGLVEPNFLGFTGAGGIDEAQLDAIRQVPGVELAAPVSVVGYLSYTQSAPIVYRTDLPTKPTLYQLDLTASTSDGLRSIVLQRQTARWLIGTGDFSGSVETLPRTISDGGDTSSSGGAPGGKGVVELAFRRYLPTIVSPLIAVDPVAEEQLLGPSEQLPRAARGHSGNRAGRRFGIRPDAHSRCIRRDALRPQTRLGRRRRAAGRADRREQHVVCAVDAGGDDHPAWAAARHDAGADRQRRRRAGRRRAGCRTPASRTSEPCSSTPRRGCARSRRPTSSSAGRERARTKARTTYSRPRTSRTSAWPTARPTESHEPSHVFGGHGLRDRVDRLGRCERRRAHGRSRLDGHGPGDPARIPDVHGPAIGDRRRVPGQRPLRPAVLLRPGRRVRPLDPRAARATP